MVVRAIQTSQAPAAIGPYSQAIRVGEFLFLSGQIPLDPTTQAVVAGGIAEQTRQVLSNIKGILSSEKLSLKNIVKTTVFLKDMGEFAQFNEIYAQAMTQPFPARSTVEVARLPKDVRVEIEVVAYVG